MRPSAAGSGPPHFIRRIEMHIVFLSTRVTGRLRTDGRTPCLPSCFGRMHTLQVGRPKLLPLALSLTPRRETEGEGETEVRGCQNAQLCWE